jgi:type III pantothenate kinase
VELFMDFGNSAVKWATGEELTQGIAHRTASKASANQLIGQLQLLEKPSRVHIATVLSSERLRELSAWMTANWRIEPVFAQTHNTELGVVNGYRDTGQLGVDRWLGLLAGRALSKQPLLVVDCGTATTLDVMDAQGRHLGGAILPGLELIRHCLYAHTDLSETQAHAEIDGFATDTATGIASGAMLATTSAIEAMLERLRSLSGGVADCLLTGGLASRVADHLSSPYHLVPNLILQGLRLQAGLKNRQ